MVSLVWIIGSRVFEVHGKDIPFLRERIYRKDWEFISFCLCMDAVNHFDEEGLFKCSVATIPMFGSGFTGFICGLYIKSTFVL